MKISQRLIIGYLVVAVLASIPLYFTLQAYNDINHEFERMMNDSVEKVKTLEQLKFVGLRIVSSTSEFGFIVSEQEGTTSAQIINDEDHLLTKGREQFELLLKRYEDLVKVSALDKKNSLESIRAVGYKLLQTSDEIIQLKKSGLRGEVVLDKKEEFEKYEIIYMKTLDDALFLGYEELHEERNNVQSTIIASKRLTWVTTGLTFLLAIGIGLLISYSITNPLKLLKNAARKIGEGDLETVIEVESNDEVGDLAQTFKTMIADLKDSRDDLVLSHHLVENILGSMADMLITVDDDGNIQRVNQATLLLLGYEENEIVGKPVKILVQNKMFLAQDEFEKMLKFKKLLEVEKDFVRKNGEKFKVELSCSILQGKTSAAVMVAKDISKRLEDEMQLRLYAKKLEQSNRELEDFAYVASHDLQEPLRKVQAFGDRLQRKCADSLSVEGNDYVRRMRDAAGRMQNLINDLLTFSRLSSKAQPFQSLDITKIAKEVISDLEVRLEQTGGKVEIGDFPVIDADPLQMRQLLQNLIGNALKFHRPNESPIIKIYADVPAQTGASFQIEGKEIQTTDNGDHVCKIIVEDNGIGFEEKYLDKIFTVFQRLHGRADYEGSGIGLAICRKIVERHGGAITAKSEPNQGATFFVTLPIAQTNKELIINEKTF